MSAQYDYYFSVTGTEKEFISGLIDYLHNIDSRIVCSSDVDTEFSTSDLTHVPTFNFSIDGSFSFTLKRSKIVNSVSTEAPLSDSASGYIATFGSLTINITFAVTTAYAWDYNATRGYFISDFVNSNFILLLINTTERNWQNVRLNNNMSIVYCKSGTNSFYAINNSINSLVKSNVFNISDRTFYDISDELNAYGTFLTRFDYLSQPGKIDYIRSSVYLSGDQKKFDITCIYDCTEVPVCSTVSLSDGPYYAVGPHQLVKV